MVVYFRLFTCSFLKGKLIEDNPIRNFHTVSCIFTFK